MWFWPGSGNASPESGHLKGPLLKLLSLISLAKWHQTVLHFLAHLLYTHIYLRVYIIPQQDGWSKWYQRWHFKQAYNPQLTINIFITTNIYHVPGAATNALQQFCGVHPTMFPMYKWEHWVIDRGPSQKFQQWVQNYICEWINALLIEHWYCYIK